MPKVQLEVANLHYLAFERHPFAIEQSPYYSHPLSHGFQRLPSLYPLFPGERVPVGSDPQNGSSVRNLVEGCEGQRCERRHPCPYVNYARGQSNVLSYGCERTED